LSGEQDSKGRATSASSLDELIGEVSKRLQFNLDAYGKVWTGEHEDTAFICRPILDEIVRLREALKEIAALEADDADPGFAESPDYWAGVGAAAHIAREALSPSSSEALKGSEG
jgi:hypothetical protein